MVGSVLIFVLVNEVPIVASILDDFEKNPYLKTYDKGLLIYFMFLY